MRPLSDFTLDHLRRVVDLPDFTGTRYRLEREIGRGGLGVVYRARDCELDRLVAIKVLELPGEARTIAALEHPAIVPVYDAGVLPDGRAYYAMKLVAGKQLDEYVAGRPSLSERLRMVRQVGEALAFAHTRGVLHRDLKPQNVMVGEFGQVYVMDWGVEGVAGTPPFRPPEQAGGGPLDCRSDVYALGALLAAALPARAPRPLQAVTRKAMEAAPGRRYVDVPALLREIDRFEDLLAVEAFPESLWERSRRFIERNQVLLVLLAAYVAVRFFLFFLRNF